MSPGPKRGERDRAPVAVACGSPGRDPRGRRSRCRSRRPRGTPPVPARRRAAPRPRRSARDRRARASRTRARARAARPRRLGPFPPTTEYHNRGGSRRIAGAIVAAMSSQAKHLRALALARRPSPSACRRAPGRPRPRPDSSSEAAQLKALLRSRELWATIDVCNPADQPNTSAFAARCPATGTPTTRCTCASACSTWTPRANSGSTSRAPKRPSTSYVGAGSSVRQGGRSFQLVPRTGKPALDAARGRLLPVAPGQDGPAEHEQADERRGTRASRAQIRPGSARRAV